MTTPPLLPPNLVAKLVPILPDDERFMSLAINLAKKGQFTTRPNPCVGCVIVKDGAVIGKGFHPKAGLPHAEIFALNDAKEQGVSVQGATAYVTLEPCSYFGKTPPCADALVKSGISRVVVAGLDPNPKVAGQGIAMLINSGVAVSVGVCQSEAQSLNQGFLKAMSTGLPYVRLKMGISLDGRIAMASGESKWITSETSRADVQRLRAKSGAIITGSGTIIADNPSLTVRLPAVQLANIDTTPIAQPKIVVVDRTGKTANANQRDSYQVFKDNNTLIWQEDLPSLLKTLVAHHQCYDVLVEAGATLATSFLQEGLVDEFIIYQAPCLLGNRAKPMFDGSFDKICEQLRFSLVSHETIGDDIKLVFQK